MTPEEKKEKKRLYDIEYRKKNADKIKHQKNVWYGNNKDKIVVNKNAKKLSDIKYAKANKDKLNIKKKLWAKNNPDKIKIAKTKHFLKRLSSDSLFKLKHNIMCGFRQSFKRKGFKKSCKTANILGCSFDDFKIYLESKFETWMSWDNYGLYNGELNYGWDLDHIIPLSSAKTEEDVIRLNHFSNLQPLCSKVNRDIKKNKF